MRVLVCGSRNWTDYGVIERRMKMLPPWTVIIEGEARGVDRAARLIAKHFGLEVKPFPAKWKKYGKAAGPIRNQQMLDEGKPDLVLAYPMPDSVGTKDMIARAKKAEIPVEVVMGIV